ncbi:hypothetical protein HHI36_017089 [Cryptolaemus montrouzieri]|uniref:Uncharacterized protein n=1 Tax=Cryptolaemus montrouzieri TaxID=559131 RepID=A0ABD2NLK6_9CUCU
MPTYERIDSGSASAPWGSFTGLEKKLILLNIILGILLLVFMVLLAISSERSGNDTPCISTTVFPDSSTSSTGSTSSPKPNSTSTSSPATSQKTSTTTPATTTTNSSPSPTKTTSSTSTPTKTLDWF